MPIYEYMAQSGGCAACSERFEVLQSINEPPLSHCLHCGAPCRRVISAPSLAIGAKHVLAEKHVEKHGFTQYRKTAKGKYEKTAGKGPSTIEG